MTDEDQIAAHWARLNVAGLIPMTAEEILSGETQAGVPKPAFLSEHQGDETVQRVGGQS